MVVGVGADAELSLLLLECDGGIFHGDVECCVCLWFPRNIYFVPCNDMTPFCMVVHLPTETVLRGGCVFMFYFHKITPVTDPQIY
jgi:hypothetical protein